MNKIKVNSVLSSLEIPLVIQQSWQETVDLLADILGIPSALIMRVHSHEIEVFTKSSNKENTYKLGEKVLLGTGLYSETVISNQQELLIPNAIKDPLWKSNPDIDLGLVAYCGLPLTWPTGEAFGTICILDSETNQFAGHACDLLKRFQTSIQHHLANIYETSQKKYRYIQTEQENKELEAKYTALIKSIPAITYTAALDKNSTTLYISEQIESLIGFSPEECTSNSNILFEQIYPEDRQRVLRAINESHKSYLPLTCEYRMFDRKGNIKWIFNKYGISI